MKKITIQEVATLTDYYDFYRTKVTINGELIRGYMYKCDKLPPDNRRKLESYPNVVVLGLRSEYAPEQGRNAVFVGDKKFKGVGKICIEL